MLNPIACLKELKTTLELIRNVKVSYVYSNEPVEITPDKNLVVAELKNYTYTQPELQITLKLYVNKILGYSHCLKTSTKITDALENLKQIKVKELHVLEVKYDPNSRTFCQELKVTFKSNAKEDILTLTFDGKSFVVRPQTILKIERQINKLGSTIYGNQFYECQKPLKSIEGSTKFKEKQFDTLQNYINSKKVALIKFHNQTFNATLTELSLGGNNIINFKFLEAFNGN